MSKQAPGISEDEPSVAGSATAIDTSRMSEGQRAALELTEAARETDHRGTSFAAGLFLGDVDARQLMPWPAPDATDHAHTEVFLEKLGAVLREHIDPDAIDRSGEIPDTAFAALAEIGAFGIKIPAQFGGVGLSQTGYCRAAMMVGGHCANTFALLSIHQSVGVPQPVLLFGTVDQKRRYLPRAARGEISAFALTEPGVGSDPAKMTTRAERSTDGTHYILNGEKLWCSNGLKAGMAVVAARTPARPGARGESISAFIVDMDSPGIEAPHRCRFMGLRALYNGVIRFRGVRVPAENLLGTEGRGLKIALTALNSGRLSIPSACVGIAKNCLRISREWAASRVQWGSPIGRHDAIAQKLRLMAARVFAMEAMVLATARKVDADKRADIRLEAAMTKLWVTEETWRLINDAVQILGGRGYETAQSLAARGEPANPLERYLRDARVNTIFEGSSEILRLFIMREALDPHLRVAGAALNSQASQGERVRSFAHAALHYAWWYPSRWLPLAGATPRGTDPRALAVLSEVRSRSRRLARSLFHRMAFHGVALERRQALLGRHADIAAELYALATASARADAMIRSGKAPSNTADLLADVARLGTERIDQHFDAIARNTDADGYALAQRVLDGEFAWLEDGVM